MMTLGRNILVWVFRHLLTLVLILIILIVGRYVVPPAAAWLQAQAEAARTVPAQRSALAEARERFDDWAEARRGQLDAQSAALARAPEAGLRARRAGIDRSIAAQRTERLSGGQLALAAASGNSDRIFAHYRAGAETALLERERSLIDALLTARAARGDQADLATRRRQAVLEVRASYARWRVAADRVDVLNRRPLAGARNLLCRTVRPDVGCTNYRALEVARGERDAALGANRRAHATIALIDRSVQAVGTARARTAEASSAFEAQRDALAARTAELDRTARTNWILWVRQPLLEVLPTALLILAGVIFGPPLAKALLYFLVAPAAARRPPIRLVVDERGGASVGDESAASQRIELAPGQELLVVPEALQSTPHEADKATQWLLNWSMPISSLASGLVALVRIRPRRADFVRLSATGDPHAELALVTIPAGSAMVMRPRALRGLVQPVGQTTRISRHWRLGRMSSWLTLQLRYLVFHGPCLLVVQGGRGVRLEPAGPGRGINQAATIGFSAGLSYAVRRSEAFGAYLMGRQELFNDSFEGAGHYLYEHMPREGERGGLWGRGIRGLGDALLKVVGL